VDYADGRIVTHVDGPAGWITINQPERLNAMRLDMWLALPTAVATLAGEPAVRAIVVRGAGERAFVSGADIAEFETERFDSTSNHAFTAAVTEATRSLASVAKPVIAMIQGYCIGGGVVIASACDIRICSDDSVFGVPAARLGLGYEFDNYARLAALVGRGAAIQMLATARRFDAAEAFRLGYVSEVVPRASLAAAAARLVAEISANAPMSIAAAKACALAIGGNATAQAAQAAIDACFDSADYREGRAAFRGKRPPQFRGC
jgi:enoyl-CoA hydratase